MVAPIRGDGDSGRAPAPPAPPTAGSDAPVTGLESPVIDPPPAISAPAQPPPRRRSGALLATAAVLVVVAISAASVVRIRSLDGDVSDLRTENASLDEEVADLTGQLATLEDLFPLTTASMSDADLTGRYDALFVPQDGLCTYDDCAAIGTPSYTLIVSRLGTDGYGLSVEGVRGPPAPMQRIGSLYSAGGLLPESMWGSCDGAPSPTRFEFLLVTIGVDWTDGELRAVETMGKYRQYDSSGRCSAGSESGFRGVRVD